MNTHSQKTAEPKAPLRFAEPAFPWMRTSSFALLHVLAIHRIEVFEVKSYTRGVSDHPGIMTCSHFESFARMHHRLLTVRALDSHLARQYKSDMCLRWLARLLACVLRPSPTRTVFSPADNSRFQDNNAAATSIKKAPLICARFRISSHHVCHRTLTSLARVPLFTVIPSTPPSCCGSRERDNASHAARAPPQGGIAR